MDLSQEMSAAEIAMTFGDPEAYFQAVFQDEVERLFPLESSPRPTLQQGDQGEVERFSPLESDSPRPTLQQVDEGEVERLSALESDSPRPTLQQYETVSKELDAIFGPSVSPIFPSSFPSPPRMYNEPAQVPEFPELSETEVNEIYTDPWLANNTHQTPDFSPRTPYFYPDPSLNLDQKSIGPYFIKRQEPERSVNSYPQQNVFVNQQDPLPFIPWRSQSPIPQPTQLDLDTTSPDDKYQTNPLSRYPSPAQSKNSSQPQSRQSSFDIGTPFDPSEVEDSPQEIVCNDYAQLENTPVRWSCFEYNHYGELRPGSVYSVEEIEQFLFSNPQHFTSHGYSPKLGGLTLWIQRAPRPENHCHNDLSAVQCRLDCCRYAGIISAGHLRVAFDENSRVSPNHNPQHNAGYVHLSCLERFLDFPRICTELIVKGEERVLSYGGLKRNRMILRTVQEVDIVDRFAKFCSANRRAPASYPAMDMHKHTRPFQGTLIQELNILGPAPYRDHMQLIWDTLGRRGVIAECERKNELKLQKLQEREKRAKAAVQRKEPAKKRKRRAREPEFESESESEPESESAPDDRCEPKRKGRKRARISKSKPNVKPVHKKRGKNELQTRKAELKSQSEGRNINRSRDDESSSGWEVAPTSYFKDDRGGQKRAQEQRSRLREELALNSSSNNNSSCNTNPFFNSGEKSKKRARTPEPEPEPPSTPSNDRTFRYPRRANGRAKRPEPLTLPNIMSEWTVNNGVCELPRPKKRARPF